MQNRLMILSVDALQTEDLPVLSTLPNFSKIISNGAVVKNIREVYPTLTNVNHTSIITGVTPDKHGVYHNTIPFMPSNGVNWNFVSKNWFWKKEYIQVPTLIDAAKEKGLKTANISWPCLGGQVPDFNFPEIWPYFEDTIKKSFEVASTKNFMDTYFDQCFSDFTHKSIIDLDNITVPMAADIIKGFNADLILEHIIILDAYRHKLGNNHPKIKDVLQKIDNLLGILITALEDSGTFESTNFIIVGDHGQMNVNAVFHMNIALKNEGLLTTTGNGEIVDYEAYSFSAGLSTHIILKDRNNQELQDKVHNILKKIATDYPEYFERIYTAEEVQKEEGLSGDFSFVIEAKDNICFGNNVDGLLSISSDHPDYNDYKSNHGYHPSKGPKPIFIAAGPDIKAGVVIDGASILDECPTFAKLLDVSMPDLMGKALDIFK